MKILNVVTFTIYCPQNRAHIEHRADFTRGRKLTKRGAERILRRTLASACVTAVETFIDER